MICKKVTIKNPTGLHLRPAGILCNEAMKYQSLITFDYDGGTANAKSVLSVLGACVKCGDEKKVSCSNTQSVYVHINGKRSRRGCVYFS